MMKQRLSVGFLMAQLWPLTLSANQSAPMLVPSGQVSATAGTSPTALPEIRSLMQAGRLAEAGREIARQLQKPDPDSTLQLLQCVVQANQNQTDKAIACLSALVKARPDMLEAYNNLGVLHASLGQHAEAKRWLTLAMQRVPSLWTVHQNLQTLQADLARKAYAHALQAELPLKDTPPRLTMLATSALSNPVKVAQANPPTMVVAPTNPPAQASPQMPASTPVVVPSNTPPALSKPDAAKPPSARTEAITATKVEVQKVEVSKAETPKPEVLNTENAQVETSKAKGLDDAKRQQLQASVQTWAQAWSAQNMAAYFDSYAPDFTPNKSTPRAAWEAERISRIEGRQFIKVSISNFSFENKGSKTAVRFNQVYESDNIQSTHRKRLDLVQIDGRWKIVRETVISQ